MECYLCGAEDNKIIHKGVRGAGNIDVYRCNKCGLVFLSQFLSDPDEFYQSSKMRNANENLYEIRKETWHDDKRRYHFWRRTIVNKKVLDFGCGGGGFLNLAKNTASIVNGVELDNTIRKELEKDGLVCFSSIEECERFVERGGVFLGCYLSISCTRAFTRSGRYLKTIGKVKR